MENSRKDEGGLYAYSEASEIVKNRDINIIASLGRFPRGHLVGRGEHYRWQRLGTKSGEGGEWNLKPKVDFFRALRVNKESGRGPIHPLHLPYAMFSSTLERSG